MFFFSIFFCDSPRFFTHKITYTAKNVIVAQHVHKWCRWFNTWCTFPLNRETRKRTVYVKLFSQWTIESPCSISMFLFSSRNRTSPAFLPIPYGNRQNDPHYHVYPLSTFLFIIFIKWYKNDVNIYRALSKLRSSKKWHSNHQFSMPGDQIVTFY